MRQIGATALVLAALVTVPGMARAQTVVSSLNWLGVLLGMGEGGRRVAVEVHSALGVNLRPAPPLTAPGWRLRPGVEARVFIGAGRGGSEVLLGAGWLATGQGGGGVVRPAIGLSLNLPAGAAWTLYGLATVGLWINTSGEMDAWGPSVAGESRVGIGSRLRLSAASALVLELDATTLSVGGGSFDPFLGVRLGLAFSPPDPEREALRARLRAERKARRHAASRFRL